MKWRTYLKASGDSTTSFAEGISNHQRMNGKALSKVALHKWPNVGLIQVSTLQVSSFGKSNDNCGRKERLRMISSLSRYQSLLNINEPISSWIDCNSGRSTAQNISLRRLSNVAFTHSPKASGPNSILFSFGMSRSQYAINPQPRIRHDAQ